MTLEERQQELTAIGRRVASCLRCPELARGRTHAIFGEGPLDPPLLLVGEAPGGDEDRTGNMFVGQAGQVLDGLLRDLGIRRDSVYLTNVLKCKPGNRKPLPLELENCGDYLARQIELVRPRAIVSLGSIASQSLLGTTETISRLRGRLHDYRGRLVLCTFHPAFLLPGRSPERRRDVLRDIVLVLRRLGLPVPRGY
jgi:DNA polymerase